MSRKVVAGQLRLGMRLSGGREVVELVRPDRETVRRGYGRMWVVTRGEDGSEAGWQYYPSAWVELADGEDAPVDRTMDGWLGRWWPIVELEA